uniref:Uncharacterized protein n=1 Tax=Arundo donax TaxID=35708 RepID=A0A0A8ZWJ5_ARUDO
MLMFDNFIHYTYIFKIRSKLYRISSRDARMIQVVGLTNSKEVQKYLVCFFTEDIVPL